VRLAFLTLSLIAAVAVAPATAQVIFADGFESGDTSAWSDVIGMHFELGHRTMTWLDAARANRSVPSELYYPAEVAGDDVPVAAGSFPVVVCGHGYIMDAASPRNLAENLVPLGFIVMLPDTETGLFPSHDDFGKDIAFLARTLQDEGAAPSSPFFGRVSPLSAASGHSMGGGAAHLAVADHAASYGVELATIATLAAARTSPSSITAAAAITAPALYLADDRDCALQQGGAPSDHYAAVGSSCKTLLTIQDGRHCHHVYPTFLCELGDCATGIDGDLQRQIVADYLVPWFEWTLKGRSEALARFNALMASDPRLHSYQQEGCEPR
jgi:hypothetical protein